MSTRIRGTYRRSRVRLLLQLKESPLEEKSLEERVLNLLYKKGYPTSLIVQSLFGSTKRAPYREICNVINRYAGVLWVKDTDNGRYGYWRITAEGNRVKELLDRVMEEVFKPQT